MARQILRGGPLQKGIIDLAHANSWHVAHFTAMQDIRGIWRTPAAVDGKGFLDLVLVRERLIMAEVKGDGDQLKPEQERWIEWLNAAGVENYVWKPSDWRDGKIDLVLE